MYACPSIHLSAGIYRSQIHVKGLVNLCGHATLASAHFLFTSSFQKYNEVEFITKSGILGAKKVYGLEHMNSSKTTATVNGEQFSIELNFPLISVVECDDTDIPLISGTLNGALVVDVKKTAGDDLIMSQRGVIITGPAPEGSGFDFFTRFFCPKLGVNEDPVCGSAHCSLAPYWARKLGKNNLVAYMASPRGGVLDLVSEEEKQRLRIRGQAVTVMTGTLLC
ncbi:unnamed protein product [Spirodela intermedia]|uniref:Uncharacterized protein n=1 Tax=Spirodela intermedia TaxID=51605 RepID=A0ABN7EDE7_SPIIN|nr:unnamed protein product [Spirodela intermedia]